MRIVILAPSIYSETACAMAAHLAEQGHVPVGALALPTLSGDTILRKLGQQGVRGVASYARSKLTPGVGNGSAVVINLYLKPFLMHGEKVFRSLRDVAAFYHFPVAVCSDQNAADSIARLREWSPELIVFTGGNILRKPVLELPRLGVLNVHLGLLPEIRGMSSPEWSLLKNVPVGITIHYMDEGIDTGPVLQRFEYRDVAQCSSLGDLRDRLIALGVEKVADVVGALDRGTISATRQSGLERSEDTQFFVMHEWLQARAAERLVRSGMPVTSAMMGAPDE